MADKPSPLRPALRAAAVGALIGMVALVAIVWASRQGVLPWQGAQTVAVRTADFAGEAASSDAQRLAQWVARTGDNRGMNFVILDKKQARVFVFGFDARLRGASPVLLGFAPGDDSASGIGQRPIEQVLPHERTTPAGRFVAEPGRNALDEDVIWVDYDAAVSMHRVRTTVASERRLERLATPTPDDNRISYGCINVPVAFYEQVLQPAFDRRYGVVYVLPETRALGEVFALGTEAGAAAQPM